MCVFGDGKAANVWIAVSGSFPVSIQLLAEDDGCSEQDK